MNPILRVFGVFIGVLQILYGWAVVDGALVGKGLCRRNCHLHQTLIDIFGQAAYNASYGMSWIIVGVGLCIVSVVVKRGKRRK